MEPADQASLTQEEETARGLAERCDLEYRPAQTLSLDPHALRLIDPGEARRLRALPLKLTAAGPIFAVADPDEGRLSEVRGLVGDNTTFVIVAPSSLEALLNSRVFSPTPAAAPRPAAPPEPAAPVPPPVAPPPAEPAVEEIAASPPPAAASPTSVQEPVPVQEPAAVEPVQRPRLIAINMEIARPEQEPTEVINGLLSDLTNGTGHLANQVKDLNAALTATRQELAETRKQLGEALADHDRWRVIVETLRDELDKSRALNDATIARLREVVGGLDTQTAIAEPAAEAETAGEPVAEANRLIA